VKIQTGILVELFAPLALGFDVGPKFRADTQSIPLVARIDNTARLPSSWGHHTRVTLNNGLRPSAIHRLIGETPRR
jgi:hypothetical protein